MGLEPRNLWETGMDKMYAGYALSVLRIMTGLLFLEHGMSKLFHFPPPPPQLAHVELMSLMGAGGVLEFFGGAAIVLGLFTRPIAFILSGEMAVAYFTVHAPRGFFPMSNGGDAAVLFCFIFLFFAAAGGGLFAVDKLLARAK